MWSQLLQTVQQPLLRLWAVLLTWRHSIFQIAWCKHMRFSFNLLIYIVIIYIFPTWLRFIRLLPAMPYDRQFGMAPTQVYVGSPPMITLSRLSLLAVVGFTARRPA
jgi:hypothetical protein